MKLNLQKKLAARVLKVSEKRVKLDLGKLDELGTSLEDFKQSITKQDIRNYINKGVIYAVQKKGISRGKARKRHQQRLKGRQRGPGTRKGTRKAREPKKETWMDRIRSQRQLLNVLREKKAISNRDYWDLYSKAKGGFFRSRRHIRIFIQEHDMIQKKA
jgi:large subunit ribosomal protein L19e